MAENYKTMKDYADALATFNAVGINSEEQLKAALPVAVKVANLMLKSYHQTEEMIKERVNTLIEACSNYVLEHPEVTDNGDIHEQNAKTKTADITLEDEKGVKYKYHLAHSISGGCIRSDGKNLAQTFITALPMALRKQEVKWVVKPDLTEAEMAENGLERKVLNTWSVTEVKEEEVVD